MSIEILTGQILDKMADIGKWQREFMKHLFFIVLTIRGRHNFENLSRYGCFNEATYRMRYGKDFDFLRFNKELILSLPQEERIIAFDPSYLPKNGKHTPGVGYFWSGCAASAKYGIEIGGFASIGLQSRTALHLYAKQTIMPPTDGPERSSEKEEQKEKYTLLHYYEDLVKAQANNLRDLSSTLVADAYFSRQSFVNAVRETDLHLISKLSKNAILRYPYLGPRTGMPGRPKKYDGDVDKENLRPEHFSLCYSDGNHQQAYEGKVYVKSFNRLVKCVILYTTKSNGQIKVESYFSTDLQMQGSKILHAYRLRFQIEFLYRDGKQHTGLSHCQSRDEKKIHTHVNASLTCVSLAKVLHHLAKPKSQRGAFSLSSIKTQYFNEHFLNRILVEFGNRPEDFKNSTQYQELYNYGCIAA